MRKATLYTIQSQRVACGDYFEMAQTFGPTAPLVRVREDGIISIDMPTVKIERLPVHAISKIEHGQRSNDYIVLTPKLREILEAPFVGRVEKLEWEKAKLLRENKQYMNGIEGYENRLEHFNTLNWFRRVWHVICGGRV